MSRTTTASAGAFNMIRSEVKNLDASMPVYELKTLEAQLDETLLTDRLIALLSAGFGLLATVLASVGLYGVMAFVVARRSKELGLRLALGAEPAGVIWLVMREVLLLLAIGLAVGIPAAVALGRFVSSQLYGIQPNDPWIGLATVALLTLVSSAAGLIPARRASRIDPILALRYRVAHSDVLGHGEHGASRDPYWPGMPAPGGWAAGLGCACGFVELFDIMCPHLVQRVSPAIARR